MVVFPLIKIASFETQVGLYGSEIAIDHGRPRLSWTGARNNANGASKPSLSASAESQFPNRDDSNIAWGKPYKFVRRLRPYDLVERNRPLGHK